MIGTRAIGGLRVGELGLGTAALGNLYAPVADAEAGALLDAALRAGIDLFDTAPFYGFGLSERRVGDGLRGHGAILSTKVGRLLLPAPDADTGGLRDGFVSPMPFRAAFDYTGDGVLRSYEASLQRLGRARIDLLLVHDIGALTHGAQAARRMAELIDGGGLAALMRLRDEGMVGAIGLGVNEVDACLEVMAHAALDVVLIAGRYTLLEQGALATLFPACRAAGTAVVVGGPFNSGILAAAPGEDGRYDYGDAPPGVAARVAALHAVCRRHDVTLPAAALAFVLAHPQVASVIPGARSAGELTANVAAYRAAIPSALWRDMIDAGLILPGAPVPA